MNKDARDHLLWLALFAAILTAALAGFNALIDPYAYFGTPKIPGVNELGLGLNHRLQLGKALALSRLKPATIILGNSRAETGYDPRHKGFLDLPVYNLAIGGSGIDQIRRYFLEAVRAGGLRHAFLALDLSMFESTTVPRDLDAVLLTDASGRLVGEGHRWRRLAFILLSGTASTDSWWSLTHQRKSVAVYLPSGLRDESDDIAQVMREGGHRNASLRVETSFLTGALRDTSSASFRAGYAAALAQLDEIIAIAAERDIRLTMVINPIHARQTHMFAAAGLWPLYEQWKRDLARAKTRSARQDAVSLWDFSGITPCTAEPLPPQADGSLRMRWYRETSHFRRALGDLVLDRVLGHTDDGACPGFGVRLEEGTLAAALADERTALEDWDKSHGEDAAEIDRLVVLHGRRPVKVSAE